MPATSTVPVTRPQPAAARDRALIGLLAAAALMAAAVIVPPLFGWDVHALTVGGVAPLAANWQPRIGWGTVPAVLLGGAAVRWGAALATRLAFGRLLAVAYLAGVAWLVALAAVDGWAGLAHVLDRPGEYLPTARATHDVGWTLRHYVERIPVGHPHNWPTHIAGHPPGALLFFVALVRLGLGGPLAAGWVVVLVAATTPVAVLLTLRRLGVEPAARRVAPLLVIGPAAVWSAVSADAVFAATAAWGLAALAVAATCFGARRVAWSLAAGLLLGYCVLFSYGLALLAVPAIGVLVAARTPRPLPGLVAGAGGVVLAFAAAGFRWWDALPVLRERYYAGIASIRPAAYWGWGDLAALAFSAGPVVGAAVAAVLPRTARPGPEQRAVVALCSSAVVAVLLADLSFMSKAEVERIWLPFVPWLLTGAALLPSRWLRRGLAVQVVVALGVQTLLYPRW